MRSPRRPTLRFPLRQLSAFAAAGALGASAAVAATIVVDTLDDAVVDDSNCSLREAVLAANSDSAIDLCPAGEAPPAIDRIEIPAGVYPLSLALGHLELEDTLEIVGAGMGATVIDGQNDDRIFYVPAGAEVAIRDLEIRNGYDAGGGGILNRGVLTLTRCRLYENDTTGSPGGGIASDMQAQATIDRCEIVSNHASDHSGGGIYHFGFYVLDLKNSLVSGNTANASGGGILAPGPLWVTNTTVEGNSAGLQGGGIYVSFGTGSSGFKLITGSTIAGNHAAGGFGGGIFAQNGSIPQVQGSIVAGNTGGPNCSYFGASFSTGGNLESPGNTCVFNQASDRVSVPAVDLDLLPLADHGGPTRTRALGPGSDAIDIAASTCPPEDQRNRPRDQSFCDAGAFEVQPGEEPAALIDVTSFEDGTFGDVVVVP